MGVRREPFLGRQSEKDEDEEDDVYIDDSDDDVSFASFWSDNEDVFGFLGFLSLILKETIRGHSRKGRVRFVSYTTTTSRLIPVILISFNDAGTIFSLQRGQFVSKSFRKSRISFVVRASSPLALIVNHFLAH